MKLRMAVFLVACVTGVTIAVLWGTLRRLVRAPSKLVTTESGRRDPKNDSDGTGKKSTWMGRSLFWCPLNSALHSNAGSLSPDCS